MDPYKRSATNEFYVGDVRFIELACAQNKYKKRRKIKMPMYAEVYEWLLLLD